MACHNRKYKTMQAVTSLAEGSPHIDFAFFIVDDHSTDGTREALLELKPRYDIRILPGNGSLFYSKSMNLAMDYLKKQGGRNFQYVLLFNDDVCFYPEAVEKMIRQSKEHGQAVIAGSTIDHKGIQSYGAVKYMDHSIRYKMLPPGEDGVLADTFNGNCVLVPWEVFVRHESMDPSYAHSMGDFDYGMMLKEQRVAIYGSKEYVGRCESNPAAGTWLDPSLSFFSRIRKKESRKGLPLRDWFHYLKKYFGLKTALWHSITPYVKILIHR